MKAPCSTRHYCGRCRRRVYVAVPRKLDSVWLHYGGSDHPVVNVFSEEPDEQLALIEISDSRKPARRRTRKETK